MKINTSDIEYTFQHIGKPIIFSDHVYVDTGIYSNILIKYVTINNMFTLADCIALYTNSRYLSSTYSTTLNHMNDNLKEKTIINSCDYPINKDFMNEYSCIGEILEEIEYNPDTNILSFSSST